MFFNQFGINQAPAPPQLFNVDQQNRNFNQQRMLTPPNMQQAMTGQMAMPTMSAAAPGTPPANAVGMPPAWSTPPFNPNGAPAAPAATPAPVAGAPAPAGVANEPVTTEPLTIDQEGNIVPENTDPTLQPGTFKLREGVTRGDRFRAGFMMLSASGTPQFTQVAGAMNAGLLEKQRDADLYNQQLLALTRTRTEEGEDKDGNFIRKIYQPAYEYDPAAGVVREIPTASRQGPTIEQWTADGWKPYAPGNRNEDRETFTDEMGWVRYKDDLSLVQPDLYEEGHEISAEGRLSATRFLREEYKADIKPIADEIDQIDLAVTTAAQAYTNPDSTKAEKTEADRALVKLVEKLWDPTSAVLGGEFETAQAAQSWLDSAKRTVDITSGETLGDDKRRAMLDILRQVGEEKVGVYNERASDLSSRAASAVAPYRPSQVTGVVDAALPRAWRTDADGNVGEVGTYIPRTLDPAWTTLTESPWWNSVSTPQTTKLPPVPPEVDEMAKEMLERRNTLLGLTGAIE